jgi:4-amino-4-deoxy-L-arabinose transferase-like glycosyltransferase
MFSKISPIKKYAFTLILLIIAVFGTLKIFHQVQLGGYDERAYNFYMNTVNTYGIGAISSLSQNYYKVPENERPPIPIRAFFIFTGALTCQIADTCGLQNLAMISLFSRIFLILIAFFWLIEIFDPKIAFSSAVLLLLSPAGLWSAERALQDSFFALIMIAGIIAYHYCWKSENRPAPFIFSAILVAGFLTKESMVFLYPCFLVVGIYYWGENKTINWKRTLVPIIISPFIYLLIISSLVGSLSDVIRQELFFIQGMNKIAYVVQFQLGPWYRPIIDWMLVSPVVFLLAVVGIVIPVSSEKINTGRNLMSLYFVSGLLVFGAFSIQNLRYVLFLDVFICVLAVIGALSLSEKVKNRRYQMAIFLFILLIVAGTEVLQFFKIFVVVGVYDPVTSVLISALGFTP